MSILPVNRGSGLDRVLPRCLRRGEEQDGGDIGCRYTPEMPVCVAHTGRLEMLKLAFELRRKGIIEF